MSSLRRTPISNHGTIYTYTDARTFTYSNTYTDPLQIRRRAGPIALEENIDVLLEAVRRVFAVHLQPGTRIMDPGSRNLASESQNQNPDTQNPETQSPKLEPEPETITCWNPELLEAVRRVLAVHLHPDSRFPGSGFGLWFWFRVLSFRVLSVRVLVLGFGSQVSGSGIQVPGFGSGILDPDSGFFRVLVSGLGVGVGRLFSNQNSGIALLLEAVGRVIAVHLLACFGIGL